MASERSVSDICGFWRSASSFAASYASHVRLLTTQVVEKQEEDNIREEQ